VILAPPGEKRVAVLKDERSIFGGLPQFFNGFGFFIPPSSRFIFMRERIPRFLAECPGDPKVFTLQRGMEFPERRAFIPEELNRSPSIWGKIAKRDLNGNIMHKEAT
jgi:hypothetical protein